jgi:hypothetical protein
MMMILQMDSMCKTGQKKIEKEKKRKERRKDITGNMKNTSTRRE